MSHLKLYNDSGENTTLVSNRFIDEYIKDANDAQIKVYLFLLRSFQAGEAISVSDIADKFNHTEKDVIRALKYWEKNKLLCLDYDEDDKTLVGIRIKDISGLPRSRRYNSITLSLTADNDPDSADPSPDKPYPSSGPEMEIISDRSDSPIVPPADPYAKPVYTTADLNEFKQRKNTRQLLLVAEQYIGKPLSVSDMKSILFFTDVLGLSDDLIDYLIQYCVDLEKRDFKYIEKVAVNWAANGIRTPEEAELLAEKYNKNVYTVMNALGKNSFPTDKEMEFFNRWFKEYDFPLDIILEACERTVLATDKRRLEYAESILKSWHKENVHSSADIEKIDSAFRQNQKKKTPAVSVRPAANNRFNQFTQNEYDFDALEKKLISN